MKNVLEYLEETAGRYPDRCAVTDQTGSLTWKQLAGRCRRAGSALAEHTARRRPVIVFMEKGIDALTAFFGAVYAGAFYVLLDPSFPENRLRQIREVLDGKVIVTDRAHLETAREVFPDCRCPGEDARQGESVLLLDKELCAAAENPEVLAKLRSRALDTDPLYVNFTSGSTGVPKGVVISHRSVLDFIGVFARQFGIGPEDVLGNQAPFDFDVSVKDIYTSLATGARLVIIPRELFSRPAQLVDYLCEQKVTNLTWAVSALCLVDAFHTLDYRTPSSVRRVLFSGEVMPLKHLRSWMEHLPEAVFVNLYGPTEITCNCTYHVIDRNRDYAEGIPAGTAFDNEEVFLLDEQGKEVTLPGIQGEICVRGSALALGYYNNPEQTAAHFRPDPRETAFPAQYYATGDLGKYNEQGELMFCGRMDDQIKYMGHRVELAEIEMAMGKLPGVDRACCLFDGKKSRLYGIYSGEASVQEVHGALREVLPVYMVPGKIRKTETMPVTPRGKVDRRALAEMFL